MPTFETSLFAEVPGSKMMKPPMKQENKHSTYLRLLFEGLDGGSGIQCIFIKNLAHYSSH